jgi:pilus assembly protein CpaE
MRAVLTSDKPGALTPYRQTVAGMGMECSANDCVSFDDLRPRLGQQPPADLVLVFAAEDQVAALAAVQHATLVGVAVVAVTGDDQEYRNQLRRAGALDCIRPDNLRGELEGAVEKLDQQGVVRARRGEAVAVLAVQPGSGVTTVATGLAFALAARQPGRVLLAEVGNGVPEVAMDLDLDVKHSVGEVARNWQRSDPYMLRQAAVAHEQGVHVLGYPAGTLTADAIAPDAMTQLVVLARSLFDRVVLDLGHSVSPAGVAAVKLSASAFVVLRPEVPSVRLTRDFLRALRDAGAPVERMHAVLNRTGHRKQMSKEEVEKVIGIGVVGMVPDEPATVIDAQNEGQPLIAFSRRARITKSFDRLAEVLGMRTALCS